ncbi:MAG: hypothetical protein Kapaf2KO_10430 [Candidatus Kapaibacteriales bacterium]
MQGKCGDGGYCEGDVVRIEQYRNDNSDAWNTFLASGISLIIPGVTVVLDLIRAGKNATDYFYFKKLYRFAKNIKFLTENEKIEFKEMLNDSENPERTSNFIIHAINQSDSFDKIDIIKKLIKASIDGIINVDDIGLYTHLVNISYIGDILYLVELKQHKSRDI